MLGLRRKNKEEDKENEEEVKKPTRTRRRKKSEGIKPWGKKERYFVLVVFLVTITLSAGLAIYARGWKLPGMSRISLPKLEFLKSGTVVITGDGEPEELEETAEKTTKEFKSLTKELSGIYGFYYKNLETGFSFGLYDQEKFQAASLMKLPLMYTMYSEHEDGSIDLESEYTLVESDKLAGSGSLSGREEGLTLTYRQLVELMGKQSDNTAQKVSTALVGEEKVIDAIETIGMKNTDYEENLTSPKDIGIFFEKLWNGELLNAANTSELMDNMTNTIYEDHLGAGIPSGTKVSHKYGREVHVVNDGGVVFADEPFVLVIMSKGVIESEADEMFPTLVTSIYENISRK